MKKYKKILAISLILIFSFSISIAAANVDSYLKGIEAYYKGDYKKAVSTFDNVLQKNPQNSLKIDTLYFQTLSYSKLFKVNEAKNNIKQLEHLGYELGKLYWELGKVYLNEKGQFDSAFYSEALEQFEKARDLGITSADFHRDMAFCYQELGRLSKAASEYKKALLYKGEAKDYLNLASLAKKMGNTEEAIQYYEKAIEIQPESNATYLELGRLYVKKANYSRAIDLFKKGVKYRPNFVPLRFELASAYYANKNYSEAINEFKNVLDQNKNYYRAYFYIGKIHYKKENFNQAINMFNE